MPNGLVDRIKSWKIWGKKPEPEKPSLPTWKENLLSEEGLQSQLLKHFGQNTLEMYAAMRRNRQKMGSYIEQIGDANVKAVLLRQLGQEDQQTRLILSQMLYLSRTVNKTNAAKIAELTTNFETRYTEMQAKLKELEERPGQTPAIEDIVKATMPTLTKRMNSRDVKAVLGFLTLTGIVVGLAWWGSYKDTEAGRKARMEELESIAKLLKDGPKTRADYEKLAYLQQFQQKGEYATTRDLKSGLDNQTTLTYRWIGESDNSMRGYVDGQLAQKMGRLDAIEGLAKGADTKSTTAINIVADLQRKSAIVEKGIRDLEQKVGAYQTTSSNDIEKIREEYDALLKDYREALPKLREELMTRMLSEEYEKKERVIIDRIQGLRTDVDRITRSVQDLEKRYPAPVPEQQP